MTEHAGSLVLVIDDVSPIVKLMELELKSQGFRTASALIADDPVRVARDLQPDAIVLSSSLPTPMQYMVLESLVSSVHAPVVFLHTGGNESDAAVAMQMGASDTLAQPFAPEDLTLRIRALLGELPPEWSMIRRGNLTIDPLHRVLFRGDRKIALATNEWTILMSLAQQEGPVSPTDLLAEVWGPEYKNETEFLELWVEKLRINLGDTPGSPETIQGDLRAGYRLTK